MQAVAISHYSDIFCVWAYVAQARIDELESHFGKQIDLDYHFVSIFGSVRQKIEAGWGHRGGAAAYGQHVLSVGERFPHLALHPDVWAKTIPESSMPCHAFLCALCAVQDDLAEGNRCIALAVRKMRDAFFAGCRDISQRSVQLEIAEELGFSRAAIEECLDSGRAFAVLHDDFERAREQGIQVSPTLVFNEGRQRLTGNVGYRVIEANIAELLQDLAGEHQASWC